MTVQSLQLQLIRRILEIQDPEVLQWLASMLQNMPSGLTALAAPDPSDTAARQPLPDAEAAAREIQQSIDEFFNPSVEE